MVFSRTADAGGVGKFVKEVGADRGEFDGDAADEQFNFPELAVVKPRSS
jgi:hypothetical protein